MTKNFILIEPDPVVRMDIEGLLVEVYPGCTIGIGASLEELGTAVYYGGPQTTLFVRGSLISENDDIGAFVRTAATRGSHVVTVGEAEDFGYPVTVIELPFTTDMVMAAIVPGNGSESDGNVQI